MAALKTINPIWMNTVFALIAGFVLNNSFQDCQGLLLLLVSSWAKSIRIIYYIKYQVIFQAMRTKNNVWKSLCWRKMRNLTHSNVWFSGVCIFWAIFDLSLNCTFHFRDGHTESREFLDKRHGTPWTEGRREKARESMKAAWTDERREAMSERIKKIRSEKKWPNP